MVVGRFFPYDGGCSRAFYVAICIVDPTTLYRLTGRTSRKVGKFRRQSSDNMLEVRARERSISAAAKPLAIGNRFRHSDRGEVGDGGVKPKRLDASYDRVC